jgi:exopolysaccharide biosynthesis polyprenyl glycosylphosphotransferase
MLREQAKVLGSLLAVLDVLTVAGINLYVTLTFHPQNPYDLLSISLFLSGPCVFLLALYHFGAYRSFRVSVLQEEVLLIAHAVLLGGAGILGISWFTPQGLPGRTELAVLLIFVFAALCCGRLCLRIGLRLARSRGFNVRYFLIVGDGLRAREVREELALQSYWGIRVLGHLQTVPRSRSASLSLDLDVIGELGELDSILQRYVVDAVFFVVEELTPSALQKALECCQQLGVEAMVDLHPFEKMRGHLQLSEFAHSPLLVIQQTRLEGPRAFFKRAFDIAVAGLALFIFSPLMLLIAGLVRLTTPGSALFRQQRVGMHGRLFTMLKFRTMVDGAEKLQDMVVEKNEMDGPVFKMRHDPRITWLGSHLRHLSLDELPQLWNVLAGHMSIVGPRPPLPHEVEQYQSWQRRRLSVRPGLTCLWQVSGRNDLSFERWMKLDLDYIDNWSWRLDLKILWRTLPAMVRGQ